MESKNTLICTNTAYNELEKMKDFNWQPARAQTSDDNERNSCPFCRYNVYHQLYRARQAAPDPECALAFKCWQCGKLINASWEREIDKFTVVAGEFEVNCGRLK